LRFKSTKNPPGQPGGFFYARKPLNDQVRPVITEHELAKFRVNPLFLAHPIEDTPISKNDFGNF
jgi:hypothetical protein